jgi:hypothetical protein
MNCHPEARVVCEPKDLNVKSLLEVSVEILRPSLSDDLKMTASQFLRSGRLMEHPQIGTLPHAR